MEEEYNIIVKWAQEDVETSYSLLNNNNNNLITKSLGLYFTIGHDISQCIARNLTM